MAASSYEQEHISLEAAKFLKNAAAELAKVDGVSLNQFIAAAVAEKVGTLRTAREFLQQRAGSAKPEDLSRFGGRPRWPPVAGETSGAPEISAAADRSPPPDPMPPVTSATRFVVAIQSSLPDVVKNHA